MTAQPLTYHCPHCQAAVSTQPQGADEVITCPSCARPFKLELPAAKPEEVPAAIVLPPGTEASQPAVPAVAPAAAGPVTAEEPETVNAHIQVSMWRRYPLRCAAYALLALVGFVGAMYFLSQGWNVLAALCGIGLAVLAWRGVSWWLRMRNTSITITNRRCVIETGLFTREATEFGRKDVVDVQVSQNPLMRILNVGDLIILSNNGTQKQIVLMAVPDPDAVAKQISVGPPPVPVAPVAETTPAETTSAA